MALVAIPGGRFTFGLLPEQLFRLEVEVPGFPYFREMPAREVSVAPFRIDKTPVTNAEYFRFVDKGGYRGAAFWRADIMLLEAYGGMAELVDSTGKPGPATWVDGRPVEGTGDHPVSGVSWFEARAYANFVGRRLPTEIEWEWAARGKDGRLFPWGNEFDPEACPLGQGSRPVASRPGHVSPFGVMDMGGLVAEWCSDVFRRHMDGEPEPGPDRVLRGDHDRGAPITVRATVRTPWAPVRRHVGFGFRTAESPQPDRLMPKLR